MRALLLVAGCLAIVVAIAANPWTLESYVVLDGIIENKAIVVAAELCLLVVGVVLIIASNKVGALSPRERQFAGIAALFSGLVGLVAGELVLRGFVDPSVFLMGQTRMEYLIRQNPPPAGGVTAEFDQHDPDLGWRPVANYDKDGIRTNGLGLRADRDYPFERQPGMARIVVIGDSFTWGDRTWSDEMTNEETYPAQLESSLLQTEVLNLGVRAYGTDQQLLRYEQLGVRFEPDLTILGFYEHNYSRNEMDFFVYLKPRLILENGQLKEVNAPIPPPEEFFATKMEMPTSYLAALVKKGIVTTAKKTTLSPLEERPGWRVTSAILSAVQQRSREIGSKFLLVYIPMGGNPFPSATEQAIEDWSDQADAPLMNTRKMFAALPEDIQSQVFDGHWTALGNELVADALEDYIRGACILGEEHHSPAPAARTQSSTDYIRNGDTCGRMAEQRTGFDEP